MKKQNLKYETITRRDGSQVNVAINTDQVKADMKPATKKAALKPETANRITANIIRILTIEGAFVTRINTMGVWDAAKEMYRTTHQRKGTPDIIACWKGWFVSFEVKAGKDKHSIEQMQVQKEIEKAGGACVIIRSTDDFISWMNDHKK